jgi:hypothetical protein
MRQAINSNPVVQIAVIGVLVVVVGMFMMMNLKKGSGSSGSTADSAATPGATASGTSTPVTGAPVAGAGSTATLPPTTSGAGSTATLPPTTSGAGTTATLPPTTSGTVSPDALVPGPGLPRPVVAAYKSGKAIVLLVVRGGGIDDKLVRGSADSLSADGRVSLFVTRAGGVARYSRITQGVSLDRTPALVVVRPRSKRSSVPQAQVSYGFRSTQSVVQAVHDALYTGSEDLPYYPR